MVKMIDPNEDGITHINVYSKGRTIIGRLLSNFAHTPFTHPKYGRFHSVEGFIYWMGSGDEALRLMYGPQAKEYGRKAAENKKRLPVWEFKQAIIEALRCKIEQNIKVRFYLRSERADLPFVHYYVYGNKVITVPQWDWVIEELDKLRKELRNEKNK